MSRAKVAFLPVVQGEEENPARLESCLLKRERRVGWRASLPVEWEASTLVSVLLLFWSGAFFGQQVPAAQPGVRAGGGKAWGKAGRTVCAKGARALFVGRARLSPAGPRPRSGSSSQPALVG